MCTSFTQYIISINFRKNLVIQSVDREDDANLFTYRDVNRTHVSVVLAQSVDDLVDNDSPQNVVKFRMGCDFDTGDDLVSSLHSWLYFIRVGKCLSCKKIHPIPSIPSIPWSITTNAMIYQSNIKNNRTLNRTFIYT